jgi:hypothetical protein
MAAPHKYEMTVQSAMQWANSELEHVGRIAALKDRALQRSYAMSTLNGMAHLKDALYELATDKAYEWHRKDILKTHDAVIRTMKHLIKDYNLSLETIRKFNTNHTLSNLKYLSKSPSKTRKRK